MPWYKAGTVSVVQNSNTVTGTGTSFVTNSRVGDAFRGPDGGWYEVTNIASDTVLSISPSYQGPSNAAGVYALAPMQGYVKQSADALRTLVNQFGAVLAVLGTDPTLSGVRSALNLTDTGGLTEGTNKYYTDARVRGTTLTGLVTTDSSAVVATDAIVAAFGKLQAQVSGKAGKGANNDITSLLGLTTALSITQGGTGGTNQAAARVGLGLGSAAVAPIVGTVSQSGGVANGAIFETNTNSNGTYTKYADGTMICSGISPSPYATNNQGVNVFHSSSYAFAFPAAFVGVPSVSPSAITSSGYYCWAAAEGSASNGGFAARVVSPTNTGIAYLCYIARGRWF